LDYVVKEHALSFLKHPIYYHILCSS